MKVNAKITMLFRENGLTIEVTDDDSCLTFLDIHMSSEQICKALSRLASVSVDSCEVYGLERIGKTMEHKRFSFQIPGESFRDRKALAEQISQSQCPEGWESDNYFGSQDSFFSKDGKDYARTTRRRYIEKPEGENNEPAKS